MIRCPRCNASMEYRSSHYNLLIDGWEDWWKCHKCGYLHTHIPQIKEAQ